MYFQRISDLRIDRDVTQAALAAYLNISQGNYSGYETGRISIPIEMLLKIADFYQVSLDFLTGRDIPSAQPSPMKPGRYRHFKGGEYRLLYTVRHSETLEPMVVYQALYGERGLWVRPARMWAEQVERDGSIVKRFEFIGD